MKCFGLLAGQSLIADLIEEDTMHVYGRGGGPQSFLSFSRSRFPLVHCTLLFPDANKVLHLGNIGLEYYG